MPLKDKVLAVLEENKGKSVSGSEIARSVGMTNFFINCQREYFRKVVDNA